MACCTSVSSCPDKACSSADYRAAQKAVLKSFKVINETFNFRPAAFPEAYADLFAEGGVLSSSDGNLIGKAAIRAWAVRQVSYPQLQDQLCVTLRQFNWDCKTRTAFVERGWEATLLQPKAFTPGSTETLPAGTRYQQDSFVIYRYDCDWKLVYYRDYYDSTQYVSSYVEPDQYPAVGDFDCITPCTATDRAKAASYFLNLAYATNLLPVDSQLSKELFAAAFARGGVWSYSGGHVTGRAEIYQRYAHYIANFGETDQVSIPLQANGDCKTRTLGVQSSWQATLLKPHPFVPGSTETLPAGTTYKQDYFVLARYDSAGKLVILRFYFDRAQYVSTYTDVYPSVCVLEGSLI